jgi:hypothetical protein
MPSDHIFAEQVQPMQIFGTLNLCTEDLRNFAEENRPAAACMCVEIARTLQGNKRMLKNRSVGLFEKPFDDPRIYSEKGFWMVRIPLAKANAPGKPRLFLRPQRAKPKRPLISTVAVNTPEVLTRWVLTRYQNLCFGTTSSFDEVSKPLKPR